MDQANFERVVHDLGLRMHELRSAALTGDRARADVTTAALQELTISLEELTVAEEELRRRHLELASVQVQVEAERRRYQEMYWTAPHPYVTTDLHGVISEANRAIGDLLEISPLALHGKPLSALIGPPDRPRLITWLRSVRLGEEVESSREVSFHTFGATREVPCALEVTPVGRRDRRDALRWSVTDLRGRSLALESARLRAEASRKDEFMMLLGHELRDPLAAIAMAAEVVENEPITGRARWGMGIVRRHGDQLRRLIDDLLDVTRVGHGSITIRRQAIDLADIVAHAVEAVERAVEARRQTIEVERSPVALDVEADADRLRQVVVNLLDNASKYSPPDRRIWVRIAREGDRALVSVRDEGIGIAPEHLQRIFGMFQQGGGTDRSSPAGLGLGLALARQLIELHAGTLEARSGGQGTGSEFIVTLPLSSPPPGLALVGRTPDPPGERAPAFVGPASLTLVPRTRELDTAALRILLADDNEDSAEVLGLCLERLGHTVVVVHDGAHALAVSERGHFDAAVLDLGMPTVDGLAVARQLRDQGRGIFLLALTGYADSLHRASAREAGFDQYVVKPATVADLDRILRTRRQLKLLA